MRLERRENRFFVPLVNPLCLKEMKLFFISPYQKTYPRMEKLNSTLLASKKSTYSKIWSNWWIKTSIQGLEAYKDKLLEGKQKELLVLSISLQREIGWLHLRVLLVVFVALREAAIRKLEFTPPWAWNVTAAKRSLLATWFIKPNVFEIIIKSLDFLILIPAVSI